MEHKSAPMVGVEGEVQLLPSPKAHTCLQSTKLADEEASTAVFSRAAAWLPLNAQGIKL